MTGSEVRYVNSGGVHIAYRVFGDGPVDLVWFQRSPRIWSRTTSGRLVRWNARLVSFSRLIVFDKRSTGLSDHAPGPVVLEDTMQDVLAVLDAAGAERPAVIGDLEGAALSALFAATHPERTRALVLYAPLVKGTATDDFPWALAPELQHLFGEQLSTAWGSDPWPGRWQAWSRQPGRRPAVPPVPGQGDAQQRQSGSRQGLVADDQGDRRA